MRYIYNFIPIPIFQTNCIPKNFDALSFGVLVLIRPDKNNEALIEHELTHCKQFYRSFGINSLAYLISSESRYQLELEAWSAQIQKDHTAKHKASQMLSTAYGLDISLQQAQKDVEKVLNQKSH